MIEAIAHRPWSVIFGAGVVGSRPSNVLYNRLFTAASLYHAGKSKRLLASGNRREVKVMTQTLMSLNVPSRDIELDDEGVRTFATCQRARNVFDIDDAHMVSNAFHIRRCVFLARAFGIDAEGVAAERQRPISVRSRLKNRARENVALTRAFIDVGLLRLGLFRVS